MCKCRPPRLELAALPDDMLSVYDRYVESYLGICPQIIPIHPLIRISGGSLGFGYPLHAVEDRPELVFVYFKSHRLKCCRLEVGLTVSYI